jgi:hypothetical protein
MLAVLMLMMIYDTLLYLNICPLEHEQHRITLDIETTNKSKIQDAEVTGKRE